MLSLSHNDLYQRCCEYFRVQSAAENTPQVLNTFTGSQRDPAYDGICDSIQLTQGYLCGLLIGNQDPHQDQNLADFEHCINADLPLKSGAKEAYNLMSDELQHELKDQNLNLFIASEQEEPNAAVRCLQLVNIAYGLLLGLNSAHIATAPCAPQQKAKASTRDLISAQASTEQSSDSAHKAQLQQQYNHQLRKLAELFPNSYMRHQQVNSCAQKLQDLVLQYFKLQVSPTAYASAKL